MTLRHTRRGVFVPRLNFLRRSRSGREGRVHDTSGNRDTSKRRSTMFFIRRKTCHSTLFSRSFSGREFARVHVECIALAYARAFAKTLWLPTQQRSRGSLTRLNRSRRTDTPEATHGSLTAG